MHDDRLVSDLPKFLKPGDRLVLNDTKVLPVRMSGVRNRSFDGNKIASANIEVTLLTKKKQRTWDALIKPLRRMK